MVVDTALFQRMRHIKQLGVCSLVFPGAKHDRQGLVNEVVALHSPECVPAGELVACAGASGQNRRPDSETKTVTSQLPQQITGIVRRYIARTCFVFLRSALNPPRKLAITVYRCGTALHLRNKRSGSKAGNGCTLELSLDKGRGPNRWVYVLSICLSLQLRGHVPRLVCDEFVAANFLLLQLRRRC